MSNNKLAGGRQGQKDRMLTPDVFFPESLRISSPGAGINGSAYPNITPKINMIPRATCAAKNQGASIILGNSPMGPGQGYATLGRNSSISLTCGPSSGAGTEISTDPSLYVNPSPKMDAAGLCLYETADVDEDYELAKGSGNAVARSAACLKSDATRIIGRDGGIKLITSPSGEYNSKSAIIICPPGIDLIAKNDDTAMEPLVKGKKLRRALKKMNEKIDKLSSIIQTLSLDQIQLMIVLASHIHVGVAGPVAPSIELAPVVIQNIKTLAQSGLSESFGLRAAQIIDEMNALTSIGFDSITSGLNRTS